jgi:hypothetical protein
LSRGKLKYPLYKSICAKDIKKYKKDNRDYLLDKLNYPLQKKTAPCVFCRIWYNGQWRLGLDGSML